MIVRSALRRFLVGAGLLALALAPAPATYAQTGATERGVKAAFVYKFLGYVEWPPTGALRPDAPIVVGVLGADDIAVELAELVRGRNVEGRAIEVRRMRAGDALAGLSVLFVGAAERARAQALERAAHARGILTITEADDGLDQGSIINLVVTEGRVRFDVALDAAERAGIKLSSRLLAVARVVRMPGGSS
jgi:hypothetical protein